MQTSNSEDKAQKEQQHLLSAAPYSLFPVADHVDEYVRVGKAPLAAGRATVDLSQLPSGFYKVVLQGRHNTVNRWVRR